MTSETAKEQRIWALRQIARHTYQKIRIGRPHLPHEDTVEGQYKIDRLFDVLAKHALDGASHDQG